MPINYRHQGILVWIELFGDYSMEELKTSLLNEMKKHDYTMENLKQSFEDALRNPIFPGEALLLIDETRSTSLERRNIDDIKNISSFLANTSISRVKRCAIVVSSDKQFELCRMGEAYAHLGGMDLAVLYDPKDALRWLEVESKWAKQ